MKLLVGIISDTHDDMDRLRKAVELFNSRGVRHVLHAGDFVSPFTFEVLGDLRCPLTGIFGNNDGDRVLLRDKSKGGISAQPLLLELGGRRAAVVHEPAAVEALAASGHFDLVVYGHTHTPNIRTIGDTLIINPGKAARLHKGRSTLAVLDTSTMEAEVIEL